MKLPLYGAAFAAACSLSSPVLPQLVGEAVEGTRRICYYLGSRGYTSASDDRRAIRVGFGENCPGTYPQRSADSPPPPTAMLQSERIEGDVRRCVYGQSRYTWEISLAAGIPCPIAAGMVPQNPRS